jgi:toxin ParE1/3/4
VAEYRLTVRAQDDVLNIYAFTEAKFGRYQAEAYHAGLERTFGLLADFAGIGVTADELVAGYRRFRFQSHYIFYTQEPDHNPGADPCEARSAALPIRLGEVRLTIGNGAP